LLSDASVAQTAKLRYRGRVVLKELSEEGAAVLLGDLACHLLLRTLHCVPQLVRAWCVDAQAPIQLSMKHIVSTFMTRVVVDLHLLQAVKQAASLTHTDKDWADAGFTVQVHESARKITVCYEAGDLKVPLDVSFGADYPLSPVQLVVQEKVRVCVYVCVLRVLFLSLYSYLCPSISLYLSIRTCRSSTSCSDCKPSTRATSSPCSTWPRSGKRRWGSTSQAWRSALSAIA
jgi:hypothetical protein